MKNLLYSFLFMGILISARSQETLVISGDDIEDTYVTTENPSYSYYWWGNLDVGLDQSGFWGPTYRYRSLIQFELLSIPYNATIVSASLKLRRGYAQYGSQNAIVMYPITENWSAYSTTYNNQPAFTASDSIAIPSGGSSEWINIDIKNFVEDWVSNPSANNGFILKLQNETGSERMQGFYSSESTSNGGGYRPEVTVTYTVPPPVTIDTFPYHDGFETASLWTNQTSYAWSYGTGETPTTNTGPSSGSRSDSYLYVEASYPNYPSKEFIFQSPKVELPSTTSFFYFDYHMWGSNSQMGDLYLEISTDQTSWSSIWSKSGNHGSSWHTDKVSLASYSNQDVYFRFRAVTGSGGARGDISLDNIVITGPEQPLVAGSVVGGDVSVCEDSAMPTLSVSGFSGGNGIYFFQWEYSDNDGSTWPDLEGEHEDSYTLPENLDYWNDYQYRVKIYSGTLSSPSNIQYVDIINNPSTNDPGTLTSNVSGDICPFVDVQFTFNNNSGVSSWNAYLEGNYNGEWHRYGRINNPMTIMVHDGEKFRVNYESACKQMLSAELELSYNCNYPPTTDKNFVRIEIPRVEITTQNELSSAGTIQKQTSFSYYDGLGRPLQSVLVSGTNSNSESFDTYSIQKYEESTGRRKESFLQLATPVGNRGGFKTDLENEILGQYQTDFNESKPYSEVEYEAESGRIISSTPVGSEWHTGNKKQEFNQFFYDGLGTGSAAIQKYVISYNATLGQDVPSSTSVYAADEIYIAETINEEGLKVQTLTDMRGREIGSRVWFATESRWVTTYTVYDALNRPRFNIPPNIAGQTSFTQDEIDHLMFQTEYDDRGRVTRTRVPGQEGWNLFVYDRWDRLVLTQNPVQALIDEWNFVKYDHLNREIITGVKQYTSVTHQSLITQYSQSSASRYETRTNNSTGYSLSNSDPSITTSDIRAVSYFDDYAFIGYTGWEADLSSSVYSYEDGISGVTLPTEAEINARTVIGEVTGSKVRILGSNDWLNTVVYYDRQGRVIQTVGKHHLLGYDRISNQIDFAGNLDAAKTDHYQGSWSTPTLELEVLRSYLYDPEGRLLQASQKIDSEPSVLIAEYEHNKYGEVIAKNIHSTDGGTTFLQSMDFIYSVQGWVEEINKSDLSADGTDNEDFDDLFGAKYYFQKDASLNSNTHTGRYDGSMSALQVATGGDNPRQTIMAYDYDDLNRLSAQTYGEGTDGATNYGSFDTDYTYDDNGNLKTLTRKEENSTIDDLTYTYQLSDNGNKLDKVEDASSSDQGFDNNGGVDMPGEFLYDENGNMNGDTHKGIDMEYNELQLVSKVMFAGGEELRYVYDAVGNKLSKGYYENSSKDDDDPIWKTDYVGGIEYLQEGTAPSEIRHFYTDEGKAIKIRGDYYNEYQIIDHQGNNRVSFGWMPEDKTYKSSMEIELMTEETAAGFEIDSNVRSMAENHTPLGNESAALNAVTNRMIGPAITLEVKGGDHLEIEAWAKYTDANWNATAASGIAGALQDLFGLDGASGSPTETVYNSISSLFGGGATPGVFSESASTNEPDAFLQYLFFDSTDAFVQGGFIGVSTLAFNNWENIKIDGGFTAPEDGSVYIYVANETNADQEVFFDDLKIFHASTQNSLKVTQVNEYYPFGMRTSNSWQDENFAAYESGLFYQSLFSDYDSLLGTHDFFLRNYDAALGRWLQTDPFQQYSSPYLGMGNNGHLGIDPDGGWNWWTALAGAGVGAGIGYAASDGDAGWTTVGALAGGALGGVLFSTYTTGGVVGANGTHYPIGEASKLGWSPLAKNIGVKASDLYTDLFFPTGTAFPDFTGLTTDFLSNASEDPEHYAWLIEAIKRDHGYGKMSQEEFLSRIENGRISFLYQAGNIYVNTSNVISSFAPAGGAVKLVRGVSWLNKLKRGTTALGPRATYQNFGKSIGANYLKVNKFRKWTANRNRKFIQKAIKRGDEFVFEESINLQRLNKTRNTLRWEIHYIRKHGYKWNANRTRLFKP